MAKGIKTGGRSKGTSNKLSVAIRETLADVLTDYSNEDLRSDLKALTEHQRIKVITNLYRLLLPPVKVDNSEQETAMQPILVEFVDMGNSESICSKCSNETDCD